MRKNINGKIYNIRPGADLCGADLSGADLSGVNLSYVNLYCANLYGANFSYANLSSADLSSANLSSADLSSANLSGVNLSYANLSYADLYGAYFSGANLRYANLSYANLSCANLSHANLSHADFYGVKEYRNSHAIFQECCSRCDNDFFTIAEWGQIAVIAIKKWCWPKIISWQSALASNVFWKLRGQGWTEFYDEFVKQGGERHADDNVEHHTTII